MDSTKLSFNPFGLITINNFAKSLNVPKSTVYSWRRNENIPNNCFKKIGGTIFVIEKMITEFFNNEVDENDNL